MINFSVPIVLIIYKRTTTLYDIISILRKLAPMTIYVIADGAKNEQELSFVKAARKVIETIDWTENVNKIYSETNMGLSRRVISGLTEVFKIEKEAIILEDDCIPNLSFFNFTQKLLARYRDDPRIAMISGTNLGLSLSFDYDYTYVNYPLIWGWATWANIWKDFISSIPIKLTPENLFNIENILSRRDAAFHWIKLFSRMERNDFDSSWDHELIFFTFTKNKICVVPKFNMVSNQGLDRFSTNTNRPVKGLFTERLENKSSIQSPPNVTVNMFNNRIIDVQIYTGGFRNKLSFLIQQSIKTLKRLIS